MVPPCDDVSSGSLRGAQKLIFVIPSGLQEHESILAWIWILQWLFFFLVEAIVAWETGDDGKCSPHWNDLGQFGELN